MLEPPSPSPASRIANAPGASQPSSVSPKQLAMLVLFGTLSMLFGASVVGYLITRSQNSVWKTASMPNLPIGLVASTLLLLALSFTMHRALKAVRQNQFEGTQRMLSI